MNIAKYICYTDASSVMRGSMEGCLIAVSNGAKVKQLGTRVPRDLTQQNVDRSVHINLLETLAAVFARVEFREETENRVRYYSTVIIQRSSSY